MTTKKTILLENVTLSFANIYVAKGFNGNAPKFSANFLISKDDVNAINLIKDTTQELLQKEFGANQPKIKDTHLVLKDGDSQTWGGYANNFYVTATNGEKYPPQIVDIFGEDLRSVANAVNSGDKVNAILDIWVQNNQYGKRVNATLKGVQLVQSNTQKATNNGTGFNFKSKEEPTETPKLAFGKKAEEPKEIDDDISKIFD